nr:flavodoxin family protein [Sedimentibacter sp.]
MTAKKVSIIFHSICGNNYLIAKDFYNQFKNHDADVSIYSVEDSNFKSLAEQFPIAGQYKDEIMKTKIANVSDVLDSDIIIMGSPTYYGNVSGAMKLFMDSFSPCWPDAKLWGKKFFAFSTCANPEGGGDMCLNTMNIFAQHMGMTVIPVPSNLVQGISFPAYGLLHYVGEFSNVRLNENVKTAIKLMTKKLLTI